MNFLYRIVLTAALASPLGTVAWAQTTASSPQTLDYIVAVVNSEPITYKQWQQEVLRQLADARAAGRSMADTARVRKDILEQLVARKAQVQSATELGIKVDDVSVDRAEQMLATQKKLTVAALRDLWKLGGLSVQDSRAYLRDQLMLERLRERVIDGTVRVSDLELEQEVQQRIQQQNDPQLQTINLAQILIAVPENATATTQQQLARKAQDALTRIRQGEPFQQVLKAVSDADSKNGGVMGLRRADRYPELFVRATANLQPGQVSEVVRSNAGFHILQVVEKQRPDSLVMMVSQTRVRHILLRTDATPAAQEQALATLTKLRQQLVSGSIKFDNAARSLSQDGSASEGGDLGWISPGMFVPEFEVAMDALAVGEISQPVVSRFGVHLIQVMDRRRVELPAAQAREVVRAELRKAKQQEALRQWGQDARARAFVEYRDLQQEP